MLAPAPDSSPTDWVVERWSDSFDGQLVPTGFEACARIFHPAYKDGEPVTWAEIARAFGTVAHPLMRWEGITRRRLMDVKPAPGLFDVAPDYEWLPAALVGTVTAVLARHTTTPAACWFGFWTGIGFAPEFPTPKFTIPGREYYLVVGELADATGFPPDPLAPPDAYWGPSIWWPGDHAWFVGSDTDLSTTHVAGSRALVDDLLATELEVGEVSPETDFAHRGDDVNEER